MTIDVSALAKLARLEVSETELKTLEQEIPEILTFVETIQKADISGVAETKGLHNVMREDSGAIESGTHTETILKAAPAREGDRVAVKQVLTRKNK
ncbi:MAG: Asp-tRNA(Asn)/Glu-tRNA(Gln) amidotransferase subunit GatC [Candidatus Paceibacterota bacterium]